MNYYSPAIVKDNLFSIIKQMDLNPKPFVHSPSKDFTRSSPLGFENIIKLIISMGGNSIKKELHTFFDYDEHTVTTSAFCQSRSKLKLHAFKHILSAFTDTYKSVKRYKGYRLLAVDGCSLNIYRNPNDSETYIKHSDKHKGYNALHLNAVYDLLTKLYVDAVVQPSKKVNEYRALCDMVDRREHDEKSIIIADRGYESYNTLAHMNEKKVSYLVRGKDVNSNGIASGLNLPDTDEFDTHITINLTRKQTKEYKESSDLYKFLPKTSEFDFLDDEHVVYTMNLRFVRIRIDEKNHELLITNLGAEEFTPSEIGQLYHKRWGIETSFRELKYVIGLTSFHSKKVDYIHQEIFASLIMYNYCEMIINNIVINHKGTKHKYQVNTTVAMDICRYFFRIPRYKSPPAVEVLIQKNISPIRIDRKFPRFVRRGRYISFNYRVA